MKRSESRSVVPNSLGPHGLYSPWGPPGRNTRVGPFPSPGELPNPGMEPRCPALQAGSLPAEPPGKPSISADTTKFADCIVFQCRDKPLLHSLPGHFKHFPCVSKADKSVCVARQSRSDSLKITPESGFAPSKPLSNFSVVSYLLSKTSLERFYNLSSPWQGQEALALHSFLNNGNYHHNYICIIIQ